MCDIDLPIIMASDLLIHLLWNFTKAWDKFCRSVGHPRNKSFPNQLAGERDPGADSSWIFFL